METLVGQHVSVLAAGASHAVALLASGAVYSWGNGSYGQLGYDYDEVLGSRRRDQSTFVGSSIVKCWVQPLPRRVPLTVQAEKISCGAWHTFISFQRDDNKENLQRAHSVNSRNIVEQPNAETNANAEANVAPANTDFLTTHHQYYFEATLPRILNLPELGSSLRRADPNRVVDDEPTENTNEPIPSDQIAELFVIAPNPHWEETHAILQTHRKKIKKWLRRNTAVKNPRLQTVFNYDSSCTWQPLEVPTKPAFVPHKFAFEMQLSRLARQPAAPYAPEFESSDEEEETLPPPAIRGTSVSITPGGEDFILQSAPPSINPTREATQRSADTTSTDSDTTRFAPPPYSNLAYQEYAKPRHTAAAGPVLTWDVLDEAIWRTFKQVQTIPDPEAPLRCELFPEWSMVRQIGLRKQRIVDTLPDRQIVPNLYQSETPPDLSREISVAGEESTSQDARDLLVPNAGVTAAAIAAEIAVDDLTRDQTVFNPGDQTSVRFFFLIFKMQISNSLPTICGRKVEKFSHN